MGKKRAVLTEELLHESIELPVTEGAPQRGQSKTVKGNAFKPGPTSQDEKTEHVALNFRVPAEFRKEWHRYALESDRSGVEVLIAAFAALREKEAS